jgi:hypothetical protein
MDSRVLELLYQPLIIVEVSNMFFHCLIFPCLDSMTLFTTGLCSFGPAYPILPLLHPMVENGPEMDQQLMLLMEFRISNLTLSFHFMLINGRWNFQVLPLIGRSMGVCDFKASTFGYSYMIQNSFQ